MHQSATMIVIQAAHRLLILTLSNHFHDVGVGYSVEVGTYFERRNWRSMPSLVL